MLTISEAKEYLKRNWTNPRGINCPCCNQKVKLYPTLLNKDMAVTLIKMYKLDKAGREWVHIQSELKPINGNYAKLVHWGLLESDFRRKEDGGRSGMFRITEKGRMFVTGQITVPKKVNLYNAKKYGESVSQINIKQSLGEKFNYNELMEGSYE